MSLLNMIFYFCRPQPDRSVPFADVRLPPFSCVQPHNYEEGEEVEVSVLFHDVVCEAYLFACCKAELSETSLTKFFSLNCMMDY